MERKKKTPHRPVESVPPGSGSNFCGEKKKWEKSRLILSDFCAWTHGTTTRSTSGPGKKSSWWHARSLDGCHRSFFHFCMISKICLLIYVLIYCFFAIYIHHAIYVYYCMVKSNHICMLHIVTFYNYVILCYCISFFADHCWIVWIAGHPQRISCKNRWIGSETAFCDALQLPVSLAQQSLDLKRAAEVERCPKVDDSKI